MRRRIGELEDRGDKHLADEELEKSEEEMR